MTLMFKMFQIMQTEIKIVSVCKLFLILKIHVCSMYEIPVYPTESFEHAQKPNGHHWIKCNIEFCTQLAC